MIFTTTAMYVGILFIGCVLTKIELDAWGVIKTAFAAIFLTSMLYLSLSLYAVSLGLPDWAAVLLAIFARMFGTFFGAAVFLTDPTRAAVLAVMTFLLEVIFVSGLLVVAMVMFAPAA